MVANLLDGFTGTDLAFAVFAFAGTLFFLLRSGLMLLGGGGHHDLSSTHAVSHHQSDDVFQLLSVHSLTAFFMMFGWTGLACSRQYEMSALPSVVLALGVGGLSMLGIALLFRYARGMASPGEQYNAGMTVGQTGTVYQRIPAGGRGKVEVFIGGVRRELEALADGAEDVESFAKVQVVRVVDPATVGVKKLG